MTKAALEALVNALLAPGQPITANGMHKPSMQKIMDELYDANSRGSVLSGVDAAISLNTSDKVLIIRSGLAKLVDKSQFLTGFGLDNYTWASPLTDSVGSNSYEATLNPSITTYAHGMVVKIRFTATSSGVCTLNLNGVGSKKILISTTDQADSGDIYGSNTYLLMYDSYSDGANGAFMLLGVPTRKFRGSFDATGTDIYPAAGTGSGSAGDILAGDEFRSDPVGDNTDYGGTTSVKTIYKAIVDEPGSDPAKWRII